MLTIRETRASVRRATLLHSLRVQVLLLLVLAVLLPGLLWTPWTIEIPTTEAVRQAMVGAAIAVVVGLFLFRRVTAYPGVRAFAFILPSYAVAYGLVVLGFFGSRLDYSSVYLIESFSIALVVSFALNAWLERHAALRFYVVPAGEIDFISTISKVDWVVMSRPDVPLPAGVPLVADLRYDHAPEWERVLAEAAVNGHPVYHSKQLRESLTGRVSMEHLSENSFGSLLPNLAYRKMKRLIDLVMCVIGMPVILAITAVVAILIRLDSRGPVFFIQDRMGYRGKVFRIIKFRTMHPRDVVTDATAALQDAMTQSEDARITKIGRFLRRTRLDELPQVFNVIKGEMSLIGPRPEAVSLSHWYEAEIPFYFYRHIVRPGISGWAQVHQGHVTDLESVHEKLTYDFYYIKNFSAWLDMLIVLRTALVVVSGFGSK